MILNNILLYRSFQKNSGVLLILENLQAIVTYDFWNELFIPNIINFYMIFCTVCIYFPDLNSRNLWRKAKAR